MGAGGERLVFTKGYGLVAAYLYRSILKVPFASTFLDILNILKVP